MLWNYVTDVNIKLKMKIINKHIISLILDGCNWCEYKSKSKRNQ